MAIETLADAASFHAHMHKKILERVQGASETDQNWCPAPGKWTPLEHLEHSALADAKVADGIEGLIAEAREQRMLARGGTSRAVDVIPALMAAGAIGKPKVAPPETQPAGRSLAEIADMLAASRARHQALLPALEELDTDKLVRQIPVAGAIANLGQWYHFAGVHLANHDNHIKSILTARG